MVKAIVVEITDVEKGDVWDRVLTSTGTLRCTAGKWQAGDLAVWVEEDEFVFLSERKHDWPLGEDVTDLLDKEHEEAVSVAPATLRLMPPLSEVEQLRNEVDRLVVFCWKNNLCPFGMVRPGAHVSTCVAGFPGCACMDAVVYTIPDEPPPEAA
jgi:hypothetical protein